MFGSRVGWDWAAAVAAPVRSCLLLSISYRLQLLLAYLLLECLSRQTRKLTTLRLRLHRQTKPSVASAQIRINAFSIFVKMDERFGLPIEDSPFSLTDVFHTAKLTEQRLDLIQRSVTSV